MRVFVLAVDVLLGLLELRSELRVEVEVGVGAEAMQRGRSGIWWVAKRIVRRRGGDSASEGKSGEAMI